MNSKIIFPLVGGVALAIIITFLSLDSTEPQINTLDFTYDSNQTLKEQLTQNGILMSTPLKFQGDAIDQNCNFFKDSSLQNKIKYCTSTELKDSEGIFLGNIHMVGNTEYPQMAMAVIQTDPFISQSEELVSVFQTMIETLVCDCWGEIKPGGFESISDWIQASQIHHLEAKQITSKSEITNLTQKQIILEITTNKEGYLWKLLIDK